MNKYMVSIYLKSGRIIEFTQEAESSREIFRDILSLLTDDQDQLLNKVEPMWIVPKQNIDYIEMRTTENYYRELKYSKLVEIKERK